MLSIYHRKGKVCNILPSAGRFFIDPSPPRRYNKITMEWYEHLVKRSLDTLGMTALRQVRFLCQISMAHFHLVILSEVRSTQSKDLVRIYWEYAPMYYVYILTNWNHKVLYTGVTNDLTRRIYEHKHALIKGFTSTYNVHKLVFYTTFKYINDAIAFEKQVKGWRRSKKNALVESLNPTWDELPWQ